MVSELLNLALLLIGAVVAAYVIWSLFFSVKDQAAHERRRKPHIGFERRADERDDRRQRSQPPPEGVDRRQGPRRRSDE